MTIKNRHKMNKKGLEFKLALFAILVASVCIIAVIDWMTEWNTDYDSGLSQDLGEYNKLAEMSSEAKTQQDGVVIKSADTGTDFEGTSIRGVFGILNNIYRPFRIVFGDDGMIDSLTERFGLPDYIRQFLVTMMVISITFTLIAIFFRLSRRSA